MKPTLRIVGRHTLLASMLIVCGACEESPGDQASPPAPWQLADSAEQSADGPRFVDDDFELEASAPSVCKASEPMAPPQGYERLSVPIKIKGRSSREVPLNTMDFTLIDDDGHQFRPTLAGCRPALKTMRLTKGRSQSADLAFDVPREERSWQLVFHPFLLGRKELRAKVKVPPETTSSGEPK